MSTAVRIPRDDLRRAGHGLTLGDIERPNRRKVVTGSCACGRWSGEARVSAGAGGLRDVQTQHAQHIADVEGARFPPLSQRQREVLTSADHGRLRTGTAAQRNALLASGLVFQVAAGHWMLTARGAQAAKLLRIAEAEAEVRAHRGELARQGLAAPEGVADNLVDLYGAPDQQTAVHG